MNFPFASLLVALSFAAERPQPPEVGPEVTIRSARALDEFVSGVPTASTRYAMTGVVTRASHTEKSCVVQDATGAFEFFFLNPPFPSVGDLVAASGIAWARTDDAPIPAQKSFRVLGRAPVPAPVPIRIGSDGLARFHCQAVAVEGTAIEFRRDDIDPANGFLLLKDGDAVLPLAVKSNSFDSARSFVGARLRVTGVYHRTIDATRRFTCPYLSADWPEGIEVLTPAPRDPFAVPRLGRMAQVSPRDVTRLGPRTVVGRVLASWFPGNVLMRTDDGVELYLFCAGEETLPTADARIEAVGWPQTDFVHVNLAKAHVRLLAADGGSGRQQPESVRARDLFLGGTDASVVNVRYQGRLVRLRGVVRSVPGASEAHGRMALDADGVIVFVDPGLLARPFDALRHGTLVEVTGVCVIESEPPRAYDIIPSVKGLSVILRRSDDLTVVARPPRWTNAQLFAAVVILLLAVIAVLVWNRILTALVNRRSREVLKAEVSQLKATLRTDERTRLAVELHDALSQNLTGLSFQVSAARAALSPDAKEAIDRLGTAARMLQSSRTELKNCLSDLRSDLLDEPDFATAIRRTLLPVLGAAELSVRCTARRSSVSDTAMQAILSILRELAANAVRHGAARHVRIAVVCENGVLSLAVRDDGCGFDAARCGGPSEGHYGLTGIRERVRRFDGTFRIEPSSAGTRAEVTFRLPSTPGQGENE